MERLLTGGMVGGRRETRIIQRGGTCVQEAVWMKTQVWVKAYEVDNQR